MSLWDAGLAVPWAEMISLARSAASDPSTELGAAVAGWSYPASMIDLLGIVADFGRQASKVFPFKQTRPSASADEVAAAQAELEESIQFAD